jgi:O-antigen/teichoic acid export membrane protein
MPKIKKTAKNIAVLFAGDISTRLIGFIATAYLARILGVSNFGLISIGLAALSYALTVSSNGLPTLGVRKVIGSDNEELVGNFISARLFFSIIAIILTIVISFFIRSSQTRIIILAYSLYLIPSAFLLDWYFQAKEQMRLLVSGRLLGMIGYLIFILIFVRSENNVKVVAYSWFFGGIITSAFFVFMLLRQGGKVKIHIAFDKIRSLFLEAFPLGLANLISQVTLFFPPIFLGIVMTNKEAGFYSAAAKLVFLFLILDRVFCISFFPAITKCVKKTPNRLNQIFNQTLKWIVIIAILSGFLGILLAKPLVLFIFGEQYLNSILIFQMIISYFILTLINSVFTFTLIALMQEKTYTFSLFIGAILFFALAWILVKSFGPAGMGIGLGIYQLVGLFIMENKLKEFLEIRLWKVVIIPLLISAAIFLPIIFFTDWSIVCKILILLAGLLPLSLLLGINKTDIEFFKEKLI